MEVACTIANCSENNSLRWFGRLCSVMNGVDTTKNVCCPAAYVAPKTASRARVLVDSRPTSATAIRAPPRSITRLRPIRFDRLLIGKATSAEASDDPVAISPMVAVSWPRAAR